jgi:AcrR family transcriptional regulator
MAGRPELHPEDTILDVARELVLDGGARAATVAAIARLSGAPKGSIYYRFASLDDLLAAVWIRAVRRSQAAFIEAAQDPEPMAAAIKAALAIHDFAEQNPADARLLASMRRADLIQKIDDRRLRRELERVNAPLGAAIEGLARRLFGRATRANLERTVCAVVDLPMGALRRHLTAGARPPKTLRRQLAAAVRAALIESGAKHLGTGERVR